MEEKKYKHYVQSSDIDLIKKIYIWSTLLEPLLFFIISLSFIGIDIPQNVSRILQLFVILFLCRKLLIHKNLFNKLNPYHSYYNFFYFYLIFAFLAGLYGIICGAYIQPQKLAYTYTFTRPFFEYLIFIYYFFYFVILFRYFVKQPKEIDYFFKIFTLVLFIALFIGYFEIILIKITQGDFPGLPRHFYNIAHGTNLDGSYITVGYRFHGILGEPRDAFCFLILSLGILALKDYWKNQKKLGFLLIIFFIITLFLTQSFSGIIGLYFAAGLMIFYLIPKTIYLRKLKRGIFSKINIFLLIIFLGLIMISIIFISGSYRALMVYGNFLKLYSLMQAGEYGYDTLGNTSGIHVLELHMYNIYPIWHRWIEILNFNIIPAIIGTGLGSSSIVNSIALEVKGIMNPSANIVRIFFETGLIGLFVFISIFTHPFKFFFDNAPKKIITKIFFCMLVILGSYFAHRSVAPYIFLGIVLVVFENKLSHLFKTK